MPFPIENLKFEVRAEVMGIDARITQTMDLRDIKPGAPAPAETKYEVEAWMDGQLVQKESIPVPITPEERVAMGSVRQALAGSDLLTTAKPITPGLIDTMTGRLSFELDGKQLGVVFPITGAGTGYDEILKALDDYAAATGVGGGTGGGGGTPPITGEAR
jgi:hypothetical protein